MKTRALTTEEKSHVVGMHDGGLHGTQIAKELGLPPTTVYTVLSNHLKYDTVKSSALNEYDLSNFKVTFSIENDEP